MTHYTWKKISLASQAINSFLEICIFQIKWIYWDREPRTLLSLFPWASQICTSPLQHPNLFRSAVLNQNILSLRAFVWRQFWSPQQGWRLLLASCGWSPGALLNVLQCTGQHPQPQRMICAKVNSAEGEKSCFRF